MSNYKKWYVADFETTNYNTYRETNKTSVWLYSICDSELNCINGNNIQDFFEKIEKECYNSVVYFHNLKFDGSFIINYLFSEKYTYKEEIRTNDIHSFSTLIGEMGEFYEIKVRFTKTKSVVFRDSLKLIPLKVKQIARAFNLPIEKEIIDYGDYTINEETLHYVNNDTKIVAMAIKFFKNNNLNKLTIGSCAYNDFNTRTNLDNKLPKLDSEWCKEWRKAYRGGRSMVNPIHADKILHNVKRYDINSMYPYIMSRYPMPVSNPIPIKERGKYKFELYKIEVEFKLKRGHLPTLLQKGALYSIEKYYTETDGVEVIYISNVDFELLERHYDIKYIEFIEMYGFLTTENTFREWIDDYYAKKSISKDGMRLIYKLLINNLYGKYGSKNEGKNKIPYINENNAMGFSYSDIKEMKNYYLPIAIAIVSFAHKYLDDYICYCGKDFIYCDTDSIHTLCDLPNEVIDNKEIGKFKLEGIEETSKYVRQKCYIYKENGSISITCAGMTAGLKDYLVREYGDKTFDIFKVGLTIDENSKNIKEEDMKLRPLQVEGGVVLKTVPFSLL